MKKTALVLAMFISLPVFAGGVNTNTNVDNTAAAGAIAAPQQSISFNSPGTPSTTTTKFRNNPDMGSIGLTTTLTDTCMGSSGVSGAGGGIGLSVGTTWRDESCVHRKNSERMEALGMKAMAFKIMCLEEDVYWSAKGSDFPCRYDDKFEKSFEQRFTEDNQLSNKSLNDTISWPDGS